jgi:hypothetical protein
LRWRPAAQIIDRLRARLIGVEQPAGIELIGGREIVLHELQGGPVHFVERRRFRPLECDREFYDERRLTFPQSAMRKNRIKIVAIDQVATNDVAANDPEDQAGGF